MSLTAQNEYSPVMALALAGQQGFLNKLNSAYPSLDPESGALVIDAISSITTATPAAGTLATNKTNNALTSLTAGKKETTLHKTIEQINASFAKPGSMTGVVLAHVDKLYQDMQAQVIATLKAATIGFSTTETTAGWIDFIIPAAATVPDIINHIIQPVQYLIESVRAQNQGGTDDDLMILCTPTVAANLKSAARRAESFGNILGKTSGGRSTFDDVEMYPFTGSSFGGASNEKLFVLHKKAFPFRFKDPYTFGGGWMPGPDILYRWTTCVPFWYSTTGADLVNLAGELLNAAT